ncbi:MAG: BrnT family toxin [Bdellovibrionales bacterium]|nr:BrnT family toxin [Bdellovibrionales bacterium]
MKFNWDPKKAEFNLKKHKVSFEEATTVFFDDLAKITFDPDHSDDEHRQILIGHSHNRRLLFVIHVSIQERNTIRIISARKATKRERKDFENL